MGSFPYYLAPPPGQVAEEQRRKLLREQVLEILKSPVGGDIPSDEAEARATAIAVGPTIGPRENWFERSMGFLRRAKDWLPLDVIDPETGLPNVDVAVGPLAGKVASKLPVEEQILNFRRLTQSPQEQQLLRETTVRVAGERGMLPKAVESQQGIRTLAQEMHPVDVEHYVTSGVGPMGRAARDAVRSRMNSLPGEIIRAEESYMNMLRSGAGSADELAQAQANINRMRQDLDDYVVQVSGIRTEMGRNLVALRMEAENTIDTSYWMSRAKREMGLPPWVNLPPEKAGPVLKAIRNAQDALASGDTRAASEAREALVQQVHQLHETGWLETLITLRKVGLLTGFRTHARNIFGNAAFQVAEEVARLPASIVDVALSMGTGRRTVAGPSPMGVIDAIRAPFTSGGRAKAESILKAGPNLQKHEALRAMNSPSKALNWYANTVFGVLSYEDQLYKTYAITRSLDNQARLIAGREISEGLLERGQRSARIQELIDNPTEAMAVQAAADAEFATFNNSNVLVSWLTEGSEEFIARQGVRHGKPAEDSARFLIGAIDVAIPFKRTPANIGARMLDYSVAPAYKVPYYVWDATVRKAIPSEQAQRSISEAIGRGMTGAAAIMIGYHLWNSNRLQPARDATTPGERAIATAAGARSGSVRVGGENDDLTTGEWVSIGTLSPVGNLILLGGAIASEGFNPLTMMQHTGAIMKEQPMLTGLEEAMAAFEGGRYWESLAASTVPTIATDVGRLIDPSQQLRSPTYGAPAGQRMRESVASRIPVVMQTVPRRDNVVGLPTPTRRTGFVDPFLTTAATEHKGLAEAYRLNVRLGYGQKRNDETAETYTLRSRARGQLYLGALQSVVNTPGYDSLTDAEKAENIEAAKTKVTSALGRMTRNLAGLSDEDKQARIKETLTLLEQNPEDFYRSIIPGSGELIHLPPPPTVQIAPR